MAGLLAFCALPLGGAVDADLFDGRAEVAVAPSNPVQPATASNLVEPMPLPDHSTGQRDFCQIGTIVGGQPVGSASVPATGQVGFIGAELSVSASSVMPGDAVTVISAHSPDAANAGGTGGAAGGEVAAADLVLAEEMAPAGVRRDLEGFGVGRVAVGPTVTEQSSKQPVVSSDADGASSAPSSVSVPSRHGDYGSAWPAGL